MGWEDGDFAEEMARKQDEVPGYYCPWCKKETDLWFDQSFIIFPDGTDEGMKDRCTDCGRATDDLPLNDKQDFSLVDDYTWFADNDGG